MILYKLIIVSLLILAFSVKGDCQDSTFDKQRKDTVMYGYSDGARINVLVIVSDFIYAKYILYPDHMPRELHFFINDTIFSQIGWYRNGIKSYEYKFRKGKANGMVTRYYESGKIKCTQNYKDGYLEGKEIWFKENGRIEEIIYYKGGNRVK